MTDIIRQLEAEQAAKIEEKRKLPDFQPGDTVRVQVRVTEGTRTRVQAYEGVCIARSGAGLNENFTVRKISYGEGVERVFPVYSPIVEGVELVRRVRSVAPSFTTCVASPVRLPVFLKRKTTAPRLSAKLTRLPLPRPKLPRPLLNKFQSEIFEKGGHWPPFYLPNAPRHIISGIILPALRKIVTATPCCGYSFLTKRDGRCI